MRFRRQLGVIRHRDQRRPDRRQQHPRPRLRRARRAPPTATGSPPPTESGTSRSPTTRSRASPPTTSSRPAPVDFTVDRNTFLGPTLVGSHPQEHQDLWQIFGGGTNIAFTNNVARNTGTHESLLFQEGDFRDVRVENNLFVHDSRGYTCQIYQSAGLVFRDNTVVGSRPGAACFATHRRRQARASPGSDYRVDHNIFVGTKGNADLSTEGRAAAWGTYGYNVSSRTARPSARTASANWQPRWANEIDYPPLGLPIEAGYRARLSGIERRELSPQPRAWPACSSRRSPSPRWRAPSWRRPPRQRQRDPCSALVARQKPHHHHHHHIGLTHHHRPHHHPPARPLHSQPEGPGARVSRAIARAHGGAVLCLRRGRYRITAANLANREDRHRALRPRRPRDRRRPLPDERFGPAIPGAPPQGWGQRHQLGFEDPVHPQRHQRRGGPVHVRRLPHRQEGQAGPHPGQPDPRHRLPRSAGGWLRQRHHRNRRHPRGHDPRQHDQAGRRRLHPVGQPRRLDGRPQHLPRAEPRLQPPERAPGPLADLRTADRRISFTNNVARHTATHESLLFQEGEFRKVRIVNNLFDHDSRGYTCQIYQSAGLVFRRNTVVGSHWGCIFRDAAAPCRLKGARLALPGRPQHLRRDRGRPRMSRPSAGRGAGASTATTSPRTGRPSARTASGTGVQGGATGSASDPAG